MEYCILQNIVFSFLQIIYLFTMSGSGGFPLPVNCVLLCPSARLPSLGTRFSIGYDIYPARPVTLGGFDRALVSTGLCLEVPLGFCGLVCAPSSFTLYSSVTLPSFYLDSDTRYMKFLSPRPPCFLKYIWQGRVKAVIDQQWPEPSSYPHCEPPCKIDTVPVHGRCL